MIISSLTLIQGIFYFKKKRAQLRQDLSGKQSLMLQVLAVDFFRNQIFLIKDTISCLKPRLWKTG